jgi:enamine deaminase RidA (YjgF/YER057c/UK114 family)
MKRFFKPERIAWSANGHAHGLAHGATFKRLLISGQPGVDAKGEIPDDLETQIGLAFDNLFKVLEAGQMAVEDIVKIVAYVASPGAFALYSRVRDLKLGAVTSVSSYVEASGFSDPRWRVLIEAEAVRDTAS